MKKNPIKRIWNFHPYASLCLTALLLSFILSSARFARTNFGGEWNLTKEKSKLVPMVGQMRMVFERLKITQNGNEINISRIGQAPDGQELTMDEKITLDGKESENIFFDGAVKKKSKAEWSAAGKAMTISSTFTFNRDGNEVTIKSTEVWDTNGPDKLTIKYTSSTPKGVVKDMYVYNKR